MQRFKASANRLSVMAVVLVLPLLSACRQEVRFTQIPPLVTNETISAPKLTSLFVPVPLNLEAFTGAAEQAIGRDLKRIVAWPNNAACYTAKKYRRCEGARSDLYLTRAGTITASLDAQRLHLKIPFNYVLKARGLGSARHLRETTKGKLQAVVGLNVVLGRGLSPSVAVLDQIVWSRQTLKVLSGAIAVNGFVSARIKRMLRPAIAVLSQELQNAPIRAAARKAWAALHTPIKLASGPDVWLSTSPRYITDGGFSRINGQSYYRIAIASQMKIVNSSFEPQSELLTPLPRFGKRADAWLPSTLQVQVNVKYEGLRRALKQAWPDPLEMPGGIVNKPMRVTVNKAELYPSNDLLALGLDLDVKTPDRAFDLTGKAYFTARPVFDPATAQLQLTDVTIAKTNAILGIGPGTGKRLRLSAAPFLTGVTNSVNVSVAAQVKRVFDATNAILNQNIGNGLWLKGRFDRFSIADVNPQRQGINLTVDLIGELSITQGAIPALSANAALQKSSVKPVIGG